MKPIIALASTAFVVLTSALASAAPPAMPPAPPAPAAPGIESAKPGDILDIAGTKATVKQIDITPLVKNEYSAVFHFETADRPVLKARYKELREKYDLDKVIAPAKDEFDKLVLLNAWVHKTITFGPPKSNPQDSLAILKAATAGEQFNCSYYAMTLREAASSLGFVARDIGLKGAKGDGNGSEHSVVEIWSNQYKKWIMFDPTSGMVVEMNNAPLDAYEIRQQWFYHDGQDLSFLLGADRKKYAKSDMPIDLGTFKNFGKLTVNPDSIGKFLIILYVPNTATGGPDYGPMFIVKDKLADGVSTHTRKNPKDPATDAYWPMNQAALHLTPASAGTLKVECQTNAPDFANYRARIDDQPSSNTLPAAWTLHPGTNTLEVLAVNQLGVAGEPSKIVLEVK